MNVTRFMEAYHHSQDHTHSAFIQFKQAFEYYASTMEDITEANLSPWLDRSIAILVQSTGIHISHPVWLFHTPPEIIRKENIEEATQRKKRELELEYGLKIHEERLKGDFEKVQKDLRRDEKARQNEFARSERKKGRLLGKE